MRNSVRRRRATLALALGLVAAVGLGWGTSASGAASPAAGPPTADGPTAEGFAASWLIAQVDAGLPLQMYGGPQWGATIDAALALTATGYGGDRAERVWDAVVANRDTVVAPDDFSGSPGPFPDDAGTLAKVILLAHVLGHDPHAVGAAPGQDLVARLQAGLRTSGPDAGLYGASAPTFDGSFRQGLAFLALDTIGGAPDPTAVTWLLSQQCASGGWRAYRSDTSVACGSTGDTGPESNGTASALLGLQAIGGHAAAVSAGTGWLESSRNADGGWSFYLGDPSDPNSTAGALQALQAAGVADEPRFDGALGALLSFQLGCAAPAADRGSFTYPDTGGAANLFATVQAVIPALGATGPSDGGTAPAVDCSTTTTTSSTTTSTTSTTTSTTSSTTTTTAPVTTTTAGSTGDPVQVSDATASNSGTSGTGSSSGSSGSGLALTGGDAAPAAALGAVLLLAGLATVAVRRRGVRR